MKTRKLGILGAASLALIQGLASARTPINHELAAVPALPAWKDLSTCEIAPKKSLVSGKSEVSGLHPRRKARKNALQACEKIKAESEYAGSCTVQCEASHKLLPKASCAWSFDVPQIPVFPILDTEESWRMNETGKFTRFNNLGWARLGGERVSTYAEGGLFRVFNLQGDMTQQVRANLALTFDHYLARPAISSDGTAYFLEHADSWDTSWRSGSSYGRYYALAPNADALQRFEIPKRAGDAIDEQRGYNTVALAAIVTTANGQEVAVAHVTHNSGYGTTQVRFMKPSGELINDFNTNISNLEKFAHVPTVLIQGFGNEIFFPTSKGRLLVFNSEKGLVRESPLPVAEIPTDQRSYKEGYYYEEISRTQNSITILAHHLIPTKTSPSHLVTLDTLGRATQVIDIMPPPLSYASAHIPDTLPAVLLDQQGDLVASAVSSGSYRWNNNFETQVTFYKNRRPVRTTVLPGNARGNIALTPDDMVVVITSSRLQKRTLSVFDREGTEYISTALGKALEERFRKFKPEDTWAALEKVSHKLDDVLMSRGGPGELVYGTTLVSGAHTPSLGQDPEFSITPSLGRIIIRRTSCKYELKTRSSSQSAY